MPHRCGSLPGAAADTFRPQGEESRALIEDFKDSWYIGYADRWHSSSKDIFLYSPVAETASGMREKLDEKMAGAIPGLRAQLKEAEAAAARLRTGRR
jgi:hypothetical protein